MNRNLKPYIWILISGFAFSWMIISARLAGRACGWPLVAIMRCLVPLVVVSLWAKWDGARLLVLNSRALWMRSLAGSCSLVGTFWVLASGEEITGLQVTDIYTITNTFPIWVALLSWPMLGQFPSGMVWVSIVSSVVGVAVLQGAALQAGNFAALIVVGVSIVSALAMMGLNRLKHLDPRAVVVHFSATGLVFSVISYFLCATPEPKEAFEAKHLLELFCVGLSAAAGQYCLTRAFTTGDPARVSVASLSQFVMILALDIIVLDNNPIADGYSKLWGIPLILGPTAWLMMQRVKTSSLAPAEAPQPQLAETGLREAECTQAAD